MTNEEMLEKIKLDRPAQVIHEVTSFSKNKHGYYDVTVDMEMNLMGTKIKHYHTTLPYPFKKYEELCQIMGLNNS